VSVPRGVGVVLGLCPVRDDEELDVLKQPTTHPEAVPLVAVDLVEGLSNRHPTTFQLDVDDWKAVHQNSHVESGLTLPFDLVLVDDLEAVVVNVALVHETDVLGRPVIAEQDLDLVLLEPSSLLHDPVVR
jgi:hypothetical protein